MFWHLSPSALANRLHFSVIPFGFYALSTKNGAINKMPERNEEES